MGFYGQGGFSVLKVRPNKKLPKRVPRAYCAYRYGSQAHVPLRTSTGLRLSLQEPVKGLKDHINRTSLLVHIGSKSAKARGIPETMVCRIILSTPKHRSSHGTKLKARARRRSHSQARTGSSGTST